jgi:hypothetical protein
MPVDYAPLESYFNEIQNPGHEKHFALAKYADPTKYCYGRDGVPCPFTPPRMQDPFAQLSNRLIKLYPIYVSFNNTASFYQNKTHYNNLIL